MSERSRATTSPSSVVARAMTARTRPAREISEHPHAIFTGTTPVVKERVAMASTRIDTLRSRRWWKRYARG